MPFIGQQPTTGAFLELDSLTASATADYTLQLNGANYYPESVNNLLVSINGVIQGSSTMSLSGSTLTVGATLSSSDVIDFVRVFGNVGTISTPTDGSVTANKIGTGAVTNAKIADSTIDLTTKVTGVLPVANGGGSIKNIAYVPINPITPTGGANYIPRDNTLPQITEGAQVVQYDYTPVATTSTIFVSAYFIIGETANHINAHQAAMFFNDTCINARGLYAVPSGDGGSAHMYLYGSFTNTTGNDLDIEIRASQAASNALTINGQHLSAGTGNLTVGTSAFGGANATSATYITITEF